ncbi:MAG: C/D box methylation guide ribonucleoprotein complex aNOP56 subunit [Candidatus Nezhaarchaeota archaeon]|nr:C/D box methylation guide ribonucleoprotein complex aNOP56 subunit [Candidatus Nezhaarchaeota archaeon]
MAYLVPTFFGILICDDEGRVLYAKKFEGPPSSIAEKVLALERGELTKDLKELCRGAKQRGLAKLIVENEGVAKSLSKEAEVTASVSTPSLAAEKVRSRLSKLAIELGVASSEEEYSLLIHEVSLHLAKLRLKMAVEKQDLFIAQAVTALDELDRVVNLLVSRVREWYGYHFPEANSILSDHEAFARLVSKVGQRSKLSEEGLRSIGLPADKISSLLQASASSLGADLDEAGVRPISDLAHVILSLYAIRRELELYISSAMDYVAPNLKSLVGPLIAARLIAIAGGLEKLAKLPSSTVQLLGAEKALFRSLRTGAKPPKHGIIFQFPEVHRSPRWQRGKIARALAGKLSIAARVDYFTGEYIADELKKDLEARIKEIKEKYVKPPAKPAPRRAKVKAKPKKRSE